MSLWWVGALLYLATVIGLWAVAEAWLSVRGTRAGFIWLALVCLMASAVMVASTVH